MVASGALSEQLPRSLAVLAGLFALALPGNADHPTDGRGRSDEHHGSRHNRRAGAGRRNRRDGLGAGNEGEGQGQARASRPTRRPDDAGRPAGALACGDAAALRRRGAGAWSDDLGVERITAGVADRLERAGGYLERANGEEMLRDAERFVRTRPWVVAGAAAAAGLMASRIFKASSERRYNESSNTSTPAGALVTPRASRSYEGVSVGGQPVATPGRAS